MPKRRKPIVMSPEPSSGKFAEIRVPEVRFVGEQGGPPERLLKERLAELFRQDRTVSTAYLARVDLGDGSIGVVLGLRSTCGPDKRMIERVGSIFASIFAGQEHLNILFLSDAQEAQLTKVCTPFFSQIH